MAYDYSNKKSNAYFKTIVEIKKDIDFFGAKEGPIIRI
jgi:hypothetical protein